MFGSKFTDLSTFLSTPPMPSKSAVTTSAYSLPTLLALTEPQRTWSQLPPPATSIYPSPIYPSIYSVSSSTSSSNHQNNTPVSSTAGLSPTFQPPSLSSMGSFTPLSAISG